GAPLIDAVRESPDVVLAWSPVPGATLYHVYRTPDIAVPWVEIGQTAGTGYRDVGAVPAPPTLYNYVVRAEDGSGLGPVSNMAFELNFALYYQAAASNSSLVSFPYRYLPNGFGGPPASSLDLCREFPQTVIGRHLPCGNPQSAGCGGSKAG